MRCRYCGRIVRDEEHDLKCHMLHHATYARYLNRGDGCIMGYDAWRRVANERGLIGSKGLLVALRTKEWCNVARHFGLDYRPAMGGEMIGQRNKRTRERESVSHEQRAALDAPLTDAERNACARRGATEFSGEQGLHSAWHVVDVWR